ncbi:MAG: aminotransferase class I/II-fold pyridoxal phosphate-dependent enzyme [Candidatus Levybacteria bacterium]|nr:aminotransferase class I/II-fold pyridoxal phosphate-dependent enzyme [Candidatus Levybacteria bacterium]
MPRTENGSFDPEYKPTFRSFAPRAAASYTEHGIPDVYMKGDREHQTGPLVEASSGELPFDLDYLSHDRKLNLMNRAFEAMTRYPTDNEYTATADAIRTYWSLSDKPHIILSGGGSDRILLDVISRAIKPDTRIVAVGPTFPQIREYSDLRESDASLISRLLKHKQSSLYLRVEPEDFTLETGIKEIIENRGKYKQEQFLIYIAHPNSPAGDTVNIPLLKQLAAVAQKHNDLLVFDGAFEDPLPEEQATAPLTEEFSCIIRTGSLSKFGFPGLRFGYAIMSKELGDRYKRLEIPYPVNGPALVIATAMYGDGIFQDYRADKVPQIMRDKLGLMKDLSLSGIRYLETDPRIPIITVKGPNEQFSDELLERGILNAGGASFHPTHRGMTNQYARIAMHGSPDDADQIYRIIKFIYKKANQEAR